MSKRIRLYDVLESQCFPSPNNKGNISKTLLQTNLHSFLTTVNSNYGRELEYVLNSLGYGKMNVRRELSFTRCPLSSHSGTSQTPSVGLRNTFNLQSKRLLPFINDISTDNTVLSLINQDVIKSAVQNISANYPKEFAKISSDIVTHLDLSRRDYQLILRNSVGKQIENITGCNPFVPRKVMEDDLKEKSKDLKSCLEFAEYNGTVIGFTNLQKALEWILRKKSMRNVIKTPKDSILIYFYVDLFPWLSWSRFFTGETKIRMKVLESTNTLSAVPTVGAWLGPDTHDFVSNLGKFVFD